MIIRALLACISVFSFTCELFAQNVRQSGQVTPTHVPYWVTNGVIGDGGPAGQGNLTDIGVTYSGNGICQRSSAGSVYNLLCLGVTNSGGAVSFYNIGGTGSLSFTNGPSTFALPKNNGLDGWVLSTDGAGNTSWIAQSGGPISGLIYAANNTALKAIDTVTTSTAQRLGFYTPGDSPPITYTLSVGSCSLNGGLGDDGSQVKPGTGGGCWIGNLPDTADVTIWGAVDIGIGNATGTDSTAALNAALAWCGTQKNGNVQIGAIRVAATSADINVPLGCTLSFLPHTGWRNDGQGYQDSIANTNSVLLLSTSQTLNLQGILNNAAIFAYGLTPATSFQDAYAKIANFAGTAVTIAAPDVKLNYPFIIGFDLCAYDNAFDRPWIINAQIDCTNGLSLNNIIDVGHITSPHGLAYYLNDLNSTTYANLQLPVSNATNNGSGLIRLTVSSTANLGTGNKVFIWMVGGVRGANGYWPITVIDATTIDLQGSSYTGVNITGTFASGETMIRASSVAGLYAGQTVTGTNIPGGATIRTIDYNQSAIWLSVPTTGSGSGQALAIGNSSYTSGGVVILDNLYRSGEFIQVSGGFQMNFDQPFEYGWRVGYHLTNAVWNIFTNASCDTISDPTHMCMWWDGTTTATIWQGGEAGGVSSALVDTTTSAAASNSMTGVNVRNNVSGDPPFVVISLGGLGVSQLANLFSLNGGVVSDIVKYANTGLTTLSGTMPFLDFYPQNEFAEELVQFGKSTVLTSASPYVFNPYVAWTPVLNFGGAFVGGSATSFGRANIMYPWLDAKFNVTVSNLGTSTGSASIAGLPAKCEGAATFSGEGGAGVYTSNFQSLTGSVLSMPNSNSTNVYLFEGGTTGSSPISDINFTSSSALAGQIRCRIAYTQR